MILFDTSILVEALTGSQRSWPALLRVMDSDEQTALCTITLYEWLRGPRSLRELEAQEQLFPSDSALTFESVDARIAARLYRSVQRARAREADIAIAACAIRHGASLWTLNTNDFSDIPGLRLYQPQC